MRIHVGLGILVLMAGCLSSGPGSDASQDTGPALATAPATVVEEYSGAWTDVQSLRDPTERVSTSYTAEGDDWIELGPGLLSIQVTASIEGQLPSTWSMCVTPGQPDFGLCATGQDPIHAEGGPELAPGSDDRWVITFETGPGAATVGQADRIEWTAVVTSAAPS